MRKKRIPVVISDKFAWILTVILISSFYILDTSRYISLILIVITASIFLITIYQKKNIMHYHIPVFYFLGTFFALYCILSGWWAPNSTMSFERGITILELLVCSFIVEFYYDKFSDIKFLLLALMAAGFAITIYTFFYYGFSNILNILILNQRLGNEFANVNSIAMIISMSVIIFVYFVIFVKVKYIFLIPFVIANIVIISASGSRKALIMSIVGVFLLLLYKNKRNNFFITFIQWVVFIVIFYFFLKLILSFEIFQGINHRMDGMLSLFTGKGVIDHSSFLRNLFIKSGIDQFMKTPILGIGINNTNVITQQVAGTSTYLHNNYVELLASGGIIGFSLYYSIYVYFVYQLLTLYKNKKSQTTILCLILIWLLLVMDYGAVSYYSKSTFFYFLIFSLQIKKEKDLFKL